MNTRNSSSAYLAVSAVILAMTSSPLTLAAPAASTLDAPLRASPGAYPDKNEVALYGESYRLDKAKGLAKLATEVAALVEKSKAQSQEQEELQKKILAGRGFEELEEKELKAYFKESKELITKKSRRGLEEIGRLAAVAQELLAKGDSMNLADAQYHILLLADAIKNNTRNPQPGRIDAFEGPFVYLDYLNVPIGVGKKPATNLSGKAEDLSTVDPVASTYWKRPESIGSQDLAAGFGDKTAPALGQCTYAEPKTSFGASPGFTAECDGRETKIKLHEAKGEAFATRIFHALGFNVDPTYYAATMNLPYSRRFFTEINLRKDMTTKVVIAKFLFGGAKVFEKQSQKFYDPFSLVTSAIRKDGTVIPGANLRRELLVDPSGKLPDLSPANFKKDVEEQIATLVFSEVGYQPEIDKVDSVGAFDYSKLEQKHRRDLRGLTMLAAWINWYDARWDNTRVKIDKRNKGLSLLNVISDLGSCLGAANGFRDISSVNVAEMPWAFTGRSGDKFKVKNYTPIEDNEAFEHMTYDDAKWAGRLIAQLSAKQIRDALGAAGLTAAEIDSFAEKLINRRDVMVVDLELDKEGFARLGTSLNRD